MMTSFYVCILCSEKSAHWQKKVNVEWKTHITFMGYGKEAQGWVIASSWILKYNEQFFKIMILKENNKIYSFQVGLN